jgi:dTDP-4-dehydrorhamnose reductase
VRTIVVYGPDPAERNFFYQVLAAGRAATPMRVPVDQLGNPTFGPDLAAAALELAARGAGGVWNVAGPDASLDRVAFARLICHAAGLDDGFLVPATTAELAQPAPRPLNGALSTAKLEAAGVRMRSARKALALWSRAEAAWTYV